MEITDSMIASALIRIKSRETLSIPDDSEINHTFSEDFEKRMDKLIASFDKKERNVSFFSTALSKAAVIILSVCIGAFSLIMVSPQARADFRNAVMEFYESHIKFYFLPGDETAEDFISYEKIYTGYVPEGFTLKETEDEYEAVNYRYENEKEGLAYDVYVSLIDGLSVLTDKGKDNIEEISITGRDAYLISGENDGKPYSTLIITGNRITVTVYGQLSREEIIEVGKSVEEKQ